MEDASFATARWSYDWESIGESSAQGAVTIDDEGIVLDIPFGQLLSTGLAFPIRKDLPEEAPFVYGYAQNGDCLALQDPVSIGSQAVSSGGVRQTLRGSQLFVSKREFDPTGHVVKAEARILGLREWVGSAPMTASWKDGPDATWTLTANVGSGNVGAETLYADEVLEIEVYRSFSMSPLDVSGASISHDCVLLLKFADPKTVGDAQDVIVRFARFLSLCLGYNAEVLQIKLVFEGSEAAVSNHLQLLKGKGPKKNGARGVPIPRRAIEGEMCPLIGAWLNAESDVRNASDILHSLIFGNWDMPFDLRFLVASQVLEVLSKHDADLAALQKDVYESYRERIKSDAIDDDMRKWLLDRTSGNQKGQARLLRELMERQADCTEWLVGDVKGFVDSQTKYRNLYTHRMSGSADKSNPPSPEFLYLHCECVLMVCYAVVARLCGFTPETIKAALENHSFKGGLIHRVEGLYPAKQ